MGNDKKKLEKALIKVSNGKINMIEWFIILYFSNLTAVIKNHIISKILLHNYNMIEE